VDYRTKRKLHTRILRHKYRLCMLIPVVLWFIVFHYLPMAGIIAAFQDYRPARGYLGSEWVGFRYFIQFLTGYHFPVIIRNTFAISFLKLLIVFPAPIVFALLLNEVRKDLFKRTIQTISYLPHFISWVVVLGIWARMLSPDGGMLNRLLMFVFGHESPIPYLSQSKYMWPIMIITDLWKGIGWGSILYIAALSAINLEIYEAARIDGAGRWKQALHVTLPGILPTVSIMMIFAIGGMAYGNFDQSWILGNSPAVRDMTEIIDTYVARVGLFTAQFSLGTAAGLMQSIVGFTMVIIANYSSKKLGNEALW